MAQSSPEQGLALLDQLDEALAAMLSPAEGEQKLEDLDLQELQGAAARFARVAGQVERLLLELRSPAPRSPEEGLRQEIHNLEAMLKNKEQLLKHCQETIQNWQQSCDGLKDLHQRNICNF